MKIIDRLENITEPFKNAVITIGNFDGPMPLMVHPLL